MGSKTAWELFEESREEFRQAHAQGMQNLKDRDMESFGRAIEGEQKALRKTAESIEMLTRAKGIAAAPESTADEHERLFWEMGRLEREHHELEARPHDIAAHRAHRERLRQHILALRAHIERLRGREVPET